MKRTTRGVLLSTLADLGSKKATLSAIFVTFAFLFGHASLGWAQATQTPWRSNENGTLSINVGGAYTMGYRFTPTVNGTITQVAGYFNGTNVPVRIYNGDV